MTRRKLLGGTVALLAAWFGVAAAARGNGGPFVVKYPGGDPAAKGVLARLGPDLMPGRERRLRVVKEDLTINFAGGDDVAFHRSAGSPLVSVTAEYTIENAASEEITVDFGFPILRGIYVNPLSMMPRPDVHVTVAPAAPGGKTKVSHASNSAAEHAPAAAGRPRVTIISNSAIYGIIRSRARETIDNAVAADHRLARLVAAVRRMDTRAEAEPDQQEAQRAASQQANGSPSGHITPRAILRAYLTGGLGWDRRDAALMVEYAGLDFDQGGTHPFDRRHFNTFADDQEIARLASANLGPLAAVGEQKATQFFARLASQFDLRAAAAYESIFEAWGGDVRQRSVDLATGKVRPRELEVAPAASAEPASRGPYGLPPDPTVYARVEYFNPSAGISEREKQSCKTVLANLPVVFTFAPMNLLHYQVAFGPRSTQVVTVRYRQYAYLDTGAPESYQLAYVVHPASLWDDFGPIHLTVHVPSGLACGASVPLEKKAEAAGARGDSNRRSGTSSYTSTLAGREHKTGELFVAVEKAGWDTRFSPQADATAAAPGVRSSPQ